MGTGQPPIEQKSLHWFCINSVIIKDRWSTGDPLWETDDQLVIINNLKLIVNLWSHEWSLSATFQAADPSKQTTRLFLTDFSFPDDAAGDREDISHFDGHLIRCCKDYGLPIMDCDNHLMQGDRADLVTR